MLVREFLKIIRENPFGIDNILGLFQSFQLNQETLLQIACADSRRVELLDDMQYLQHFLPCGGDVHAERQVIHETVNVSSEIPVIVQTADYESGYIMLMFSQIPEAKLVHETLREALFYGKRVVLRPLVLAVVVHMQFVFRNGIIILQFRKRNLSWLLVSVLFLALRRAVIQNRIFLQFLADSLLKFLDRKLNELDGLDLERGELLRLL